MQTTTWGPHDVLGTSWYITLPEDCPRAATAVATAWEWLNQFDANYSRFRHDSYIGILNNTGTLTGPPATLLELLTIGIRLYHESTGRLNFLSGHLQTARGYNHAYTREESLIDTTYLPNPTTDLVYNTQRVTLHSGAVDLGSFGKGYAIDHITTLIQESTSSDFVLVNGGGDVRLHNPNRYSYPLYLQHPFQANQFTHHLDRYHGSIANSNASLRRWTTKNTQKTYSHLLDLNDFDRHPDTLAAGTVCASNAVDADAAATLLTLLLPHENPGQLLPYPYLRIFADGSSRHTPDFPGTTLG